MNKDAAAGFLANVLPEKAFWVNNGPILKSISELATELKKMKTDTFMHHVNQGKNDFANWIKDVVGDGKLTKQISKLKTKEAVANMISRRIETLKRAAR